MFQQHTPPSRPNQRKKPKPKPCDAEKPNQCKPNPCKQKKNHEKNHELILKGPNLNCQTLENCPTSVKKSPKIEHPIPPKDKFRQNPPKKSLTIENHETSPTLKKPPGPPSPIVHNQPCQDQAHPAKKFQIFGGKPLHQSEALSNFSGPPRHLIGQRQDEPKTQ
jgi:hypothetical protein